MLPRPRKHAAIARSRVRPRAAKFPRPRAARLDGPSCPAAPAARVGRRRIAQSRRLARPFLPMKVQTMSVQQLSTEEIDGVSGAGLSVDTAILATVGLMACAPLSVAVI